MLLSSNPRTLYIYLYILHTATRRSIVRNSLFITGAIFTAQKISVKDFAIAFYAFITSWLWWRWKLSIVFIVIVWSVRIKCLHLLKFNCCRKIARLYLTRISDIPFLLLTLKSNRDFIESRFQLKNQKTVSMGINYFFMSWDNFFKNNIQFSTLEA